MDRRDFLLMSPLAAVAGFQRGPRRAGFGVGAHSQGRGGGAGGQSQAPPPKGHNYIETPRSLREKFAGMYKLVRSGAGQGGGSIGRIYYDRAGRMGAMLHPPGRKPLPPNPTVEDYREVQRGLVAYYGTYSVDEPTKRVIHHIEAASNPAWIDTDFVRWYEFDGNRLLLRTSQNSQTPLVWERLPDT